MNKCNATDAVCYSAQLNSPTYRDIIRNSLILTGANIEKLLSKNSDGTKAILSIFFSYLSLAFNYEKDKYSQVTKAVVQRVKASQMAGKEFKEQLYIEEQ